MAIFETGQFPINLIGDQAQTLLLKPVFFDAEIEELFDVMVFVNKKQKIGYVGLLENILATANGCGWNPKGNMSIFDRCIETELVKGDVELCFDEFKDTVYKQLLKKGSQMDDIQGTIFMDLLLTRLVQAVKKQALLVAFFGDKASANTDVNIADGMWSVYIPQLVANNLVPYINSNSGTPLGAGDGIDLLNAVYDNATNVLSAVPEGDKVMMVSANVYRQYLKDLQNNGISSNMHLDLQMNGKSSLLFNGIEVKPMYDWQGYASSYQGINDANYVLYTERKNLVMGTDIESPLTQFVSWFDTTEEKYKAKIKFYMGFNYKHNDLITVAY
jgi:hypothetical protein